MAQWISEFSKILPPDSILTSEEDRLLFGTDWSRIPGLPAVVALPRTTLEVSRVLRFCNDRNIPVVPSGGRTGLVGGAHAKEGDLVLSLGRLNKMGPVNTLAQTVRVGAGAVTQAVHHHCQSLNLTWPIDLASKGSCQIGGNLSTNAGGVRVVRYGMTRKWVTSLQVVTLSGDVLELNSELEKNNTGYDLLQLLIGSEGTLAVITEATLKLVPLPSEKGKSVYLFALKDLKGLPTVFEKCRQGPFEIHAFEFFSKPCLDAVAARLGRRCKLSKPGAYYVLCEVIGSQNREQWLADILKQEPIVDALEATASRDCSETWGLREGITESLALTAPLRKHDLSVPVSQVAAFLSEVEAAVSERKFRLDLYFFGHFGDGSPHINVLKPTSLSQAEFDLECDRFDEILFDILTKFRGSISSEHGIGLLKKKWLPHSRSPSEMNFFRGIKAVFDPKKLLNPGKLFD